MMRQAILASLQPGPVTTAPPAAPTAPPAPATTPRAPPPSARGGGNLTAQLMGAVTAAGGLTSTDRGGRQGSAPPAPTPAVPPTTQSVAPAAIAEAAVTDPVVEAAHVPSEARTWPDVPEAEAVAGAGEAPPESEAATLTAAAAALTGANTGGDAEDAMLEEAIRLSLMEK